MVPGSPDLSINGPPEIGMIDRDRTLLFIWCNRAETWIVSVMRVHDRFSQYRSAVGHLRAQIINPLLHTQGTSPNTPL
jgi:hypothetical protein